MFASWTVPKIKEYLKDRGVNFSSYNKSQLVKLAEAVTDIRLPVDPDFQHDDISQSIEDRLKEAGCNFKDPLRLNGYTHDLCEFPEFSLYDVFNYLLYHRTEYDRKKLKAYKSFDEYRLFRDGHVEDLQFNAISPTSGICVVKAKVKPTQKDRTYLHKSAYDLWIVLEKNSGEVKAAYCECQGGSDGACRHIGAVLFDLEAMERSVTDGPSQWVKRPREHDRAVPISDLKIYKARYHVQTATCTASTSEYDPRSQLDTVPVTDERVVEFARTLKEAFPKAAILHFLPASDDDVEDQQMADAAKLNRVNSLSIFKQADNFKDHVSLPWILHNPEEAILSFVSELKISEEEVLLVRELTKGQSDCELWKVIRKGMVTASVFRECCAQFRATGGTPRTEPSSLVKKIMGHSVINEDRLPPPLQWGRTKENVARHCYLVVEGKRHKRLTVQQTGLCIYMQKPFLGCSVDGIVSCRCKSNCHPKLIEIKCPYELRDSYPKEAALKRGCILHDGVWQLNVSSPYYYQIQGCLGIYGFEQCDLVIYTRKGIHIVSVTFDKQFFEEMIVNLTNFYINFIAKEIFNIPSSNCLS